MKRTHLLLSALLLAFAASSRAGETELQALALSHQHAALETMARERLARDSLDDAALWYWGLDAASEPRLRVELLTRAQDCVRGKPQSARCQNLWGVLIAARLSGRDENPLASNVRRRLDGGRRRLCQVTG